MTFRLEIRLGNEARQDPGDVADALERLARRLRDEGFSASNRIGDLNGNAVGMWQVTGR
jgi:hypothetical protein